MGRYNLLDEAWIPVMVDNSGNTNKVSLLEILGNADKYVSLACDTKTQEFAVMRLLLAITHTVFSRFDADGRAYEVIELEDRFRQKEDVKVRYQEQYEEDLLSTWKNLWDSGKYPIIVNEYLEKWRDRFYLFDDKFPFFQVLESDMSTEKTGKNRKPSEILGKNINRKISESANKIALFSPKNEYRNNKEILSEDEIARWLITFQGYTGLSDKVIFGEEKYKASKGWLFDIGGIFLEGKNLFETLVLNMVMVDDKNYFLNSQKPSWEYSSEEILERKMNCVDPDNLAELYTTWSRAIYIDPEIDVSKAFSMSIVKLPDINHVDAFLEPMTIWRFNENGENKDRFTPRKHPINQSMWRSFGNIVLPDSKEVNKENRTPGIIRWFQKISNDYDNLRIKISAVSMQDDGNATSWVPVDEIVDSLNVCEVLVTDDEEDGWILRVTEAIDNTKSAISNTFRRFMIDIKEIRNLEAMTIVNENVNELYYLIDHPFRDWLSSIREDDDKDEKVIEWRRTLRKIILKKTEEVLSQASNRDYIGIKKDSKMFNIADAYSKFMYFLNIHLRLEEINGE